MFITLNVYSILISIIKNIKEKKNETMAYL